MKSQYLADNFGGKKPFVKYFMSLVSLSLGLYSNYTIIPSGVRRVVFVCQGNICRSALAEEVFRNQTSFPVASIGLDTQTGKPASPRMLIAAKELNYSLERHRTTSIHDFEIKEGDLLVCMQPEHVFHLNALTPMGSKVLFGSVLKRKNPRITDPYSANDIYMKKCAAVIIEASIILSNKVV